MNKNTDTWNNHPAVTDLMATFEIDHAGTVTSRGTKWFVCPKGQVAQFVMTPANNRDFSFYWYELNYPDSDGGPHGVTLEMWQF